LAQNLFRFNRLAAKPMIMWWFLKFALLAASVSAGGGGLGRRPPREGAGSSATQTVRLEVNVVGGDARSSGDQRRGRDERGHGRRRERNERSPGFRPNSHRRRSHDRSRRRRRGKGKKAKKETSSSSSSSTSPASKKVKKKGKEGASDQQVSIEQEDRLLKEIQKLRSEMAVRPAPTTPPRSTTRVPEVQWTPKMHAHLGSFCSFIHEGSLLNLVDPQKVRSWEDVKDQLNSQSVPVLKKFLGTRVPPANIPRSKAAVVNSIVDLISSAIHS
jgi:hypothetical protein